MKKLFILPFLFLLVVVTGCYKTNDKMDYSANEVVLSYPAVNQFNLAASGTNYWNKALISPDLGKKTDTILASLNIPHALNKSVTINLGVNEAAVAAYNKDTLFGPTQYTLMPGTYYNIMTPTVVIPAGTTDTTIKIAIKPSLIDISQTGYILPLTITSADGISVSPMNTAYIHIQKDPTPPYSRAAWKVVSFSSEEATGEDNGKNGRVFNVYDNDVSTFWHSKWQGGTDPMPYWFIIDMGASNIVHGIMILDRQGVGSDGRPKNMKLEVSNDLTNWTLAGNFTGADQNASWQKFSFSSATAAVRYFRLTISSVYGAATVQYSNMAELKIF